MPSVKRSVLVTGSCGSAVGIRTGAAVPRGRPATDSRWRWLGAPQRRTTRGNPETPTGTGGRIERDGNGCCYRAVTASPRCSSATLVGGSMRVLVVEDQQELAET